MRSSSALRKKLSEVTRLQHLRIRHSFKSGLVSRSHVDRGFTAKQTVNYLSVEIVVSEESCFHQRAG
jgi:hypothetical protein